MITAAPTIEKGIPLPPRKAASVLRATLATMEIGDSFILNSTNPKHDMTSVRKAAKDMGRKITARVLDNGSFRVWRSE